MKIVEDVDPAGAGGQAVPLQRRHIAQEPEARQHGAAGEAAGGEAEVVARTLDAAELGTIGEHGFAQCGHAGTDGDILQLFHSPEGVAAQVGDAVGNDEGVDILSQPGGLPGGVVLHAALAGNDQQTVADGPGNTLLRGGCRSNGDAPALRPGGTDRDRGETQNHDKRQEQRKDPLFHVHSPSFYSGPVGDTVTV